MKYTKGETQAFKDIKELFKTTRESELKTKDLLKSVKYGNDFLYLLLKKLIKD